MARKKKLTRQDAIGSALYLAIAKAGGASPKLIAFRAFMEGLNYLDYENER